MDIKDGSDFEVVRDGFTFRVQAYVDLEGDEPYPLVVEVSCDGEECEWTNDAVWEAHERNDWPAYVEAIIGAHLEHVKKGP